MRASGRISCSTPLNAVLSLIRARPQAEAALESLSDLFRAAMRDPGNWSAWPTKSTSGGNIWNWKNCAWVSVCMSTGKWRACRWTDADSAADAAALLENAVYHGIEPSPEGGTVTVAIRLVGEELRIVISNPPPVRRPACRRQPDGLANIRERLALYYDLEARLKPRPGDHRYDVRITLPCKRKTPLEYPHRR